MEFDQDIITERTLVRSMASRVGHVIHTNTGSFRRSVFMLTRFGGIQALTGLIAAAPGTTTPGTCGQRIATTTRPATATTTSGFASRARGLIPEVRSLRTPIPCVGTDQFPKTCAAAMRTKNHRVRRSGRADASNARRTPHFLPRTDCPAPTAPHPQKPAHKPFH